MSTILKQVTSQKEVQLTANVYFSKSRPFYPIEVGRPATRNRNTFADNATGIFEDYIVTDGSEFCDSYFVNVTVEGFFYTKSSHHLSEAQLSEYETMDLIELIDEAKSLRVEALQSVERAGISGSSMFKYYVCNSDLSAFVGGNGESVMINGEFFTVNSGLFDGVLLVELLQETAEDCQARVYTSFKVKASSLPAMKRTLSCKKKYKSFVQKKLLKMILKMVG